MSREKIRAIITTTKKKIETHKNACYAHKMNVIKMKLLNLLESRINDDVMTSLYKNESEKLNSFLSNDITVGVILLYNHNMSMLPVANELDISTETLLFIIKVLSKDRYITLLKQKMVRPTFVLDTSKISDLSYDTSYMSLIRQSSDEVASSGNPNRKKIMDDKGYELDEEHQEWIRGTKKLKIGKEKRTQSRRFSIS